MYVDGWRGRGSQRKDGWTVTNDMLEKGGYGAMAVNRGE